MKKINFLLTFFLIGNLFAQKDKKSEQTYFWSNNQKYYLSTDSLKVILHPKKKLDFKQNSTQMSKSEDVKAVSVIYESEEIIVEFAKKDKKILDDFKVKNPDYDMSFAYKHGKNFEMLPTGAFMLLPKNRVKISDIYERFNNKIEPISSPVNRYYVIRPKKHEDMFSLANEIYESGLVVWCHPDFSVPIKKTSIPTDTYYGNQYYLNPIAANSIFHINVEKAWDITKGVNTIKVAVIDDGVETHEDLPNVLAGKSIVLTNGGWGNTSASGGIIVQDGAQPFDYKIQPLDNFGIGEELGHGQAVSGIIGAAHNNLGIAGVAPSISIFPINIYTSTKPISGPNGVNRAWNVRYSGLAKAIDVARDNNCHVINMSVGVTDLGDDTQNVPPPIPDLVNNAIYNAVTPNGTFKGITTVVAIGNKNFPNDNTLNYPANNSLTLGVGASTVTGTIAPYSKISTNVDLVAPSGTNANNVYTIDRMGVYGYNSDNYASDFGGTSASAPQVAAVAALMLSVNPNLSSTQVVSILKSTAKSLSQPANAQGSGLVQACEAVFEAVNMAVGISGNAINGSGTISLAGLPTTLNSNVSWVVTSGSNLVNTSSGTGKSANLSALGSGTASITFTVNFNCGTAVSFTKSTNLSITVTPPSTNCGIAANKCYTIKPVNSGLNLEVAGGGTAGGESIWQSYANNCGNQVYKVEQSNESQYCKITAQYPGGRSWQMSGVGGNNAVTIGAEVKNIDYNGNASQKFYFSNATGGAYHLSTKAVIDAFGGTNTQYHYVDVFGGNNNQFNKLSLWYRNGGNNQRFIFEEKSCATSCSGNGGGGGGGSSCGMSVASVGYNCNSNILEAVTVTGDGGADLQYRADAGPWYDYHFHIQFLSPGTHTFYVRKKYETTCVASITSAICGGGGGGGASCPAAGCLSIGTIGYNCGNGILETVTVSGGSGNYQYALDNCNVWKDYQFHIQQIPNGNHTIFVRDVANTNCGGAKAMTVGCNNVRQRSNEEVISSNTQENVNGVEVFPNPASDEISIRFLIEKDQKAEISLMDIAGKVFQKREILGTGSAQNEKFTIKNISAGQYFINLKTDKLNTAKKFVKE